MEITLKIADDSPLARNIERVSETQQLSREEAALRLLEESEISTKIVPQGVNPDAWRIVGAFKEDAALMDETLEIIMEERQRRNAAVPHD